jgi:hypothetical protein
MRHKSCQPRRFHLMKTSSDRILHVAIEGDAQELKKLVENPICALIGCFKIPKTPLLFLFFSKPISLTSFACLDGELRSLPRDQAK